MIAFAPRLRAAIARRRKERCAGLIRHQAALRREAARPSSSQSGLSPWGGGSIGAGGIGAGGIGHTGGLDGF